MAEIIIDIVDIKNLGDIEKFFTLLLQAGVLYHPEVSFHEHIETDKYGKTIGLVFSEEESDRLDKLMEKCFEVADEVDANIFKISMRTNGITLGTPYKYFLKD